MRNRTKSREVNSPVEPWRSSDETASESRPSNSAIQTHRGRQAGSFATRTRPTCAACPRAPRPDPPRHRRPHATGSTPSTASLRPCSPPPVVGGDHPPWPLGLGARPRQGRDGVHLPARPLRRAGAQAAVGPRVPGLALPRGPASRVRPARGGGVPADREGHVVATCPAAPSSPGTSRSSRNRGSGWKAAA
jgi:hypothetical protein